MGKTRNKITLLDKPGMRNSQTDSEPHAKKGLPRLTNKSTKPEK